MRASVATEIAGRRSRADCRSRYSWECTNIKLVEAAADRSDYEVDEELYSQLGRRKEYGIDQRSEDISAY